MLQQPVSKSASRNSTVLVWDRWVRLFHWSLVLAIMLAAGTGFLAGATWLRFHLAGGLAALALVLMRIIWGMLGSTHARFSDFVPRPSAVLAHLSGQAALSGRTNPRHLGHNPLGALMVLALLLWVVVLGATGIAMLGGLLKTGPLASDISFETGGLLKQVHEAMAYALLALIGLHLAGVAFESQRSRENLARAMVTGCKQPQDGDQQAQPRKARGLLALIVIAVLAGGLAAANAALSGRPVAGLPIAKLAPVYIAECGSCHMAYHPNLLGAENWTALMAGLEDHFGEDARLDVATTAEITEWLRMNAAETADTKPAHRISRTSPEAPFDLTQAPFWKHTHADLPPELFKTRAIASRANCAACHQDAASGFFSPFAIFIPNPTPQKQTPKEIRP